MSFKSGPLPTSTWSIEPIQEDEIPKASAKSTKLKRKPDLKVCDPGILPSD
eukprot:CAMPEP_0184042532 /NCGR_PEP_ID=MMETSP0955-20130417/66397_1 /TAXON_ID=627963 /ORGANISM="Aplanochytrium sp, Strain PBS07" /LENGTH=50 /DNA_ID=CAMNT_0026333303 /DNA_START=130 /DNA_END=282 /DNA_ORIENTATION=-